MASYDYGKTDVVRYIRDNFKAGCTCLDVGACDGKWANLLNHHLVMDAVEIWKPNIVEWGLASKYRNVFNMDILDLEYKWYDLILFGDVIEHMTVEQARRVLDYARGKCVSGKFVERYYDGFNFGVLMYCTIEDSVSAFVDHTSILPHPLYNPVVLEGENDFEILRNGEKVDFGLVNMDEAKSMLQEAICKASQLTSLRIGDFVAVELAPQMTLASKKDGEATFTGRFCENEIFNYRIIF